MPTSDEASSLLRPERFGGNPPHRHASVTPEVQEETGNALRKTRTTKPDAALARPPLLTSETLGRNPSQGGTSVTPEAPGGRPQGAPLPVPDESGRRPLPLPPTVPGSASPGVSQAVHSSPPGSGGGSPPEPRAPQAHRWRPGGAPPYTPGPAGLRVSGLREVLASRFGAGSAGSSRPGPLRILQREALPGDAGSAGGCPAPLVDGAETQRWRGL